MVGHTESKKPPSLSSSHKRTPVAKALAKRYWTGEHGSFWNHVDKFMKNGNGHNLLWMKEESTHPAPDDWVTSVQNAQRIAQAPRQPAEKVWKPTGEPVGGCHLSPLKKVGADLQSG
jgi:hypothetical protein